MKITPLGNIPEFFSDPSRKILAGKRCVLSGEGEFIHSTAFSEKPSPKQFCGLHPQLLHCGQREPCRHGPVLLPRNPCSVRMFPSSSSLQCPSLLPGGHAWVFLTDPLLAEGLSVGGLVLRRGKCKKEHVVMSPGRSEV